MFNSYFLDNARVNSSSYTFPDNTYPENILSSLVIQKDVVLDILESLDISKASGPDGLSPKLKREHHILQDPFANLSTFISLRDAFHYCGRRLM